MENNLLKILLSDFFREFRKKEVLIPVVITTSVIFFNQSSYT